MPLLSDFRVGPHPVIPAIYKPKDRKCAVVAFLDTQGFGVTAVAVMQHDGSMFADELTNFEADRSWTQPTAWVHDAAAD